MARHREFDADEALEKAMHLFWRKGFTDTTVRELVNETGVAHAGLYAAFGGKEGLFAAALERYDREVVDNILGDLEKQDSGRAEIEGFFHYVANKTKTGEFQNGCLIANTRVEFGDAIRIVARHLKANYQRFCKAFRKALANGKHDRTIPAELDVEATAEFLTSAFTGIAVHARSGASNTSIDRIVATTLRILD